MKYTVISFVILLIHLIIGLFIYNDYSIGYDDEAQRLIGRINYESLTKNSFELATFSDKYYGPAFEMILYGMEKFIGPTSGKEIYALRHLVTFIHFWISLIVFWVILRYLFKSSFYSALGTVLLILSPRFFAESFYNTKDLPLMSGFIFSFAAYIWAVRKTNTLPVVIFAFFSAYTTAIRPFGLLFPLLFLGFIGAQMVRNPNKVFVLFGMLIFYITSFSLLLGGFWPILMQQPEQFINMLRESVKTFDQPIYYFGQYVSSASKPWHYLPVFIFITSPLLIMILFIGGLPYAIYQMFCKENSVINKTIHLSLLLWLCIPISIVYILNPRIYDGWRHLYFIYPSIIIFSLYGLQCIMRILSTIPEKWSVVMRYITVGVLVLQVFALIWFIIRSHPYQNIYFNELTKNLETAAKLFDFDYWGMSETEAIRYILNSDSKPAITIHFTDTPGLIHALSSNESTRVIVSNQEDHPDYIITQYRWDNTAHKFSGYTRIHAITRDHAILSAVYKSNNINE